MRATLGDPQVWRDIYDADSLPWALLTSLLALPLSVITVYVLRVMARFHSSLVVELLGRR